MKLDTFIQRPILSGVISVLVVIAGIVGLFSLSVEQFPDMAPPTVTVSASYAGASAETIVKSVIMPLEEAIRTACRVLLPICLPRLRVRG